MVASERSGSTYVAVAGLLLFGTITSLLAKIGAYSISEAMPQCPHIVPSHAMSTASSNRECQAMVVMWLLF